MLFVRHATTALRHGDAEFLTDLRPMYCAGAALRAHADPYAVEPVASCERRLAGPQEMPLPAPLPPYVLEPFALLATLPFGVVGALYVTLTIAAFAFASYWMAALARVRTSVAALALFWVCFYPAVNLGQLSFFAIAAIAGAAYFLQRRGFVAAGVLAACSLVQPSLALPVLAVVAIAHAPARRALFGGFAIAAVLCVLAGPSLSLEYLHAELPSHAASEVFMPLQFSATWLAAQLGAPPALALRIGSVSYLLALIFAVLAGVAFARRGRPALGLLYAASAVTVGGTFIHLSQLAVALPAGLLLAHLARRGRTFVLVATCTLGCEWLSIWYQTVTRAVAVMLLKSATESVVLAAALRKRGLSLGRAALAAIAFVLACAGVTVGVMRFPVGPPTIALSGPARVAPEGPLLSDRWRVFQEDTNRGRVIDRIVAAKLLPWLAALCIVGFGAAGLFDDSLLRREDEPAP
ncbi:MAG: DUF2029 domain-containing protein [Candidatus Eremiobacteraeota bacterium]|nr:DUF2029 domain-containing protein [Candidatus Eremiobacteraeota bacterium]